MTREEASDILELSPHASPAERSSQYDTLRRQLEDKLAKAPTPGLREKYRNNLKQLEDAFAVLAQTDDSASLPVASRERTEDGGQKTANVGSPLVGGPGSDPSGLRSQVSLPGDGPDKHRDGSSQQRRGLPAAKRKSGSREFALVAIIALAVLAAGGWFVMKTRAENAEKARVAGELAQKTAQEKLEQERKAELARQEAEAKRQGEEAEKTRLAVAQKAEQERVDQLVAKIRVELAEARLLWEPVEREAKDAERALVELRSEARSLRDSEQGRRNEFAARISVAVSYVTWITNFVSTHAVKRAQVRTAELLSARQGDTAAAEIAGLLPAIEVARRDIQEQKSRLEDSLFASALVRVATPGDHWTLKDHFGREYRGTAESRLPRVAIGSASLTTHRPGWPDQTQEFAVITGSELEAVTRMLDSTISISANASGAKIYEHNRLLGQVPFTLSGVPPGPRKFELRAPGHADIQVGGIATPGGRLEIQGEMRRLTDRETVVLFTEQAAGVWVHRHSRGNDYYEVTRGSATTAVWFDWGPYKDMRNKKFFSELTAVQVATIAVATDAPASALYIFDGSNLFIRRDTTGLLKCARVSSP